MCRIQDDDPPAVRQRLRTSAAGPFIRGLAEQMRTRLGRKSLDAIEINDQKPGKPRQRERIKSLFVSHAGKITQAQRAQLELFSLFRGR